jgi:hypothetical protein
MKKLINACGEFFHGCALIAVLLISLPFLLVIGFVSPGSWDEESDDYN